MSNRDIFERMAGHYDTEERVHNAGIIAQKVRSELTDTQNSSALDYGCGTGLVGLSLADLFKSMLLIDASPQMIQQVQRKIDAGHIGNAQAVVADFDAEVPAGVSADYILLSQVLLHVRAYEALLEKLYAVLNANGHLLIIDFDKNEHVESDLVHNGFEQSALTRILTGIGFTVASAGTFYHGKQMFMKQDASLFFLDAVKSK